MRPGVLQIVSTATSQSSVDTHQAAQIPGYTLLGRMSCPGYREAFHLRATDVRIDVCGGIRSANETALRLVLRSRQLWTYAPQQAVIYGTDHGTTFQC